MDTNTEAPHEMTSDSHLKSAGPSQDDTDTPHIYDDPYEMSPEPVYEDTLPPVYDEPYSHVKKTDEIDNNEISGNYSLPGAIGDPSVIIYTDSYESAPNFGVRGRKKSEAGEGENNGNDVDDDVSSDYGLPGAIGHPSVVFYQGVTEAEITVSQK